MDVPFMLRPLRDKIMFQAKVDIIGLVFGECLVSVLLEALSF